MSDPSDRPLGSLPARAPEITAETETFWRATAQGRLLLLRCDTCATVIWYPRSFCPDCGGRATSWEEAAGTGTVYSFTITRRGQGPWRDAGPYVMAYVELDEGPRMLTNIVDCPVEAVLIGQRVTVVFHDAGEGAALPRFRPLVEA
jgi:uncharacterized OB-fold protein